MERDFNYPKERMMPDRDPIKIIDAMLAIIPEIKIGQPGFLCREALERIKRHYSFSAPEMNDRRWWDIANALTEYADISQPWGQELVEIFSGKKQVN